MWSDKKQIENYDKVGNLALTWLVTAEELLIAAKFLKGHRDSCKPSEIGIADEGRILPTELMLRGFALENILKALWLEKKGQLARDGKYVGPEHDLLKLANAADVSLNAAQGHLLNLLYINMVSLGRYPIARDWTKTKIQNLPGGGSGPPTGWSPGADDILFEELVTQLLDSPALKAERARVIS